MKKLIFLSIVLAFLVVSCEMSPEADFSASPGDPVVGELVQFSNNSLHAESFEWDFGDGYISNDIHPSHVYTASGNFEVTLKAFSGNNLMDQAFLTIEVRIPTLLEIEVLEYYEKYPVEGASVILYSTLADWDNETNSVNEGFTDSDGKVVFSDLGNIVFYADVWEATHDNYSLRNDDVGFIRTSEVLPNKINRFIAYVDYVDHGKSAGRRDGNLVIKRIERKASEISQPGPYPNNENWKVLFDKSVKKK